MPLIRNPIIPGNRVWQCKHCGKVFPMTDAGEEHEADCDSTVDSGLEDQPEEVARSKEAHRE